LETPIDLPGDDRRNVAAVWKLVGVAAEQAPDAEDGFSMVRGKRKAKAKAKAKALTAEARRTQRGHGERRSGGTVRNVARERLKTRSKKTKSKKRKRG
jgi:hypothetical protein